jgi:hypothetical protein
LRADLGPRPDGGFATGSRSPSSASPSPAGRITAIEILADPDRLRQLDLSGLEAQQP